MASSKIEICEVGPRDGLQSEPRIWSVEERVELIDRLSATGVSRIEAVSFVNPKRVPQMADAETVMAKIKRPDGVSFVHLGWFADQDALGRFQSTPHFKEFSSGLPGVCEDGPNASPVTEIHST